MSDEGEKVCPLCTEEMDLTDQQLNPCRCGYQICVWCWHHIMDMAEKDDTEGRCPACRTPYDKEKIVGTKPNCESWLVADINLERKQKSQKAKSKTNEGRKQLTSVRVIQRNLVYIIGIPSNLADEEVLQHREYFGQYGKVLKVSISRTAGGAIQHSANNTCSVYITYSKEEEAVRCIQSVHGYVLDGKSLRACFGTTKYCHAWIRNMTCTNPDCLYLHDIGTQEDSFSKDEIVSAYTRSRVPQITGATNNLQRRAGSMLPPPCDDFCIEDSTSSAKPISKSVPNNSITQVKVSPPNSSSGRSNILPAAASWGLRVSNGRPPTASPSCSDGPAKQKSEIYNGLFPSVVSSSSQVSTLHIDVPKKSNVTEESQATQSNGRVEPLESSQQYTFRDLRTAVLDAPVKVARSTTAVTATSTNQASGSTSSSSEMGMIIPPDRPTCSITSDKDENVGARGTMHSLCSGLASLDMDSDSGVEHSHSTETDNKAPSLLSFNTNGSETTQQYYAEHVREPLNLVASSKASTSDGESVSRGQNEWRLEPRPQVVSNTSSEVDSLSVDDCVSKNSEVTHPAYMLHPFNSSKTINSSGHSLQQHSDAFNTRNPGYSVQGTLHTKADSDLLPYRYSDSLSSNGFVDNKVSNSAELSQANFSLNKFEGVHSGRYSDDAAVGDKYAALDTGESSIISDILSLDNDAWVESLTSPHNLAKLLGEADKQHGSLKISSSWKVQNSNQSRFSFARQEEFPNQESDLETSFSNMGQMANKYSDSKKFSANNDLYFDKLRNGFSSSILEEPDLFQNAQLPISSDRFSASRAHISAPPGFSLPSRPAPPGFSSQERMGQPFDSLSGYHSLEGSSLLSNQYQAQPTASIGDVEFIDPAIITVGKERRPGTINNMGFDVRSTFSPQLNVAESDPRLQMLMQQSVSSHQNLMFPDHVANRFSSLTDAYRNPSRFLEQSPIDSFSPFAQNSIQQSRSMHMSNGHWDSWNGVPSGHELGMAELLRNERLGFTKQFPSYEDLKLRMPSSADLYNRAFGM